MGKSKKKEARSYVALECTPDRLEISKYCPTCQKHTVHKEKK